MGRVYGLRAWETPIEVDIVEVRTSKFAQFLQGEDIVTILPLSKSLVDEVREKCIDIDVEERRSVLLQGISCYLRQIRLD